MISIIITGYDRYYLLAASLMSLAACGFKDAEFIMIDDGSEDPKIERIWDQFASAEAKRGNKAIWFSDEHRGLPGLSAQFRKGLELATGDFVFLVPDDAIYNRYLPEFLIEAGKRLNDQFHALLIMEDDRGPLFGRKADRIDVDGFHTVGYADGFGILMRTEDARKLDWTVDQGEAIKTGRSLIWRHISKQLKVVLNSDESVCEHIGNFYNATLRKEKADVKKIYAVNLNMFKKPKIVREAP